MRIANQFENCTFSFVEIIVSTIWRQGRRVSPFGRSIFSIESIFLILHFSFHHPSFLPLPTHIMAKDTLLDSRVSIKQAEKAVNALYDHASKVAAKEAESELLGSKEQHVWLNVTVKKLSAEHKLKPVKMYAPDTHILYKRF